MELKNQFERKTSPPCQSDYKHALEFKAQVAKQFNANRKKWFNRERQFSLEDRALQNGGRRYTNITPASGCKCEQITKPNGGSRVIKFIVRSKNNAVRAIPDGSKM